MRLLLETKAQGDTPAIVPFDIDEDTDEETAKAALFAALTVLRKTAKELTDA